MCPARSIVGANAASPDAPVVEDVVPPSSAPAVPVPVAIERLIARPACAAGLPLPSRNWTLTAGPAGFAAWLVMTLPTAAAAGCAANARLQAATCAVDVLAGSCTSVVA